MSGGSRPGRASDRRHAGHIGAAFALSAAASIGLAVVYARGGQPQLEGALIMAAMGGLGVGFILWGKRLMPQGPFVEEREPLASTPSDRETLARDFERGEETIARRSFIARLLLLALGAFGAAALFPIRSLGPRPGRSLFQTSWRAGTRVVTADGMPVSAGRLTVGGVITAFPEGHTDSADSQALLIHVDPTLLRPLPGREDWTPNGMVAYSKVCTHAGCPVGLYQVGTRQLLCPCHQSLFDVIDGARPVFGPATRSLPQLALTIDPDGFLRAQGDYDEAIGPGFWERP